MRSAESRPKSFQGAPLWCSGSYFCAVRLCAARFRSSPAYLPEPGKRLRETCFRNVWLLQVRRKDRCASAFLLMPPVIIFQICIQRAPIDDFSKKSVIKTGYIPHPRALARFVRNWLRCCDFCRASRGVKYSWFLCSLPSLSVLEFGLTRLF